MELQTTILPIRIGQTIVHARVAVADKESTGVEGEEKVASRILNFENVAQGIEEMSKVLVSVFEKICPDKVSVEFNVGISFEAGKLVALFFDTKATGSIKIALQWGKSSGGSTADE